MHEDLRWLETVSDESRETSSHRSPGVEKMFYHAVADGDISHVQENCDRRAFADMDGVGHLSDDPVMNLKYHFVVTAALITRYCTDSGMPMEVAYSLSDYYILKMDHCRDIPEIMMLHDQMVLDYTGRMLTLKKQKASSRQVADAVDYVYTHILDRVTVEDIARAVNVSQTYLSRIFKQEMGVSLSDFVRSRKIDMAKKLLRLTDSSLVEIANKLSFSSQSHFTQQFRAMVGMTPKAYRDQYYMNTIHVN